MIASQHGTSGKLSVSSGRIRRRWIFLCIVIILVIQVGGLEHAHSRLRAASSTIRQKCRWQFNGVCYPSRSSFAMLAEIDGKYFHSATEEKDSSRSIGSDSGTSSKGFAEDLVAGAAARLQSRFFDIDLQTKRSMDKVLSLFKKHKVDSSAFHGVNGYGYGDIGREVLDLVVAELLGAEAAIVRLQLFSGTHAISTALFSALRPGDTMLCVSGHPYDTLEEVIGLRPGGQTGSQIGSLRDWGIDYREIDLLYGPAAVAATGDASAEVAFDLNRIDEELLNNPRIKLIHVQRYYLLSSASVSFFNLCIWAFEMTWFVLLIVMIEIYQMARIL